MGSMIILLRPLPTLLLLLLCAAIATSQDCSATNLCATGCCSTSGYCGVGPDYCGADVCVSTCDSTATAQCDADNHCPEGCCSKFGVCGYGPDYCAKENCVSTCDQKSECDPGSWGSDFATSTTCPLNVCCSKYGFCGTTTDFCGDKTVKRPSCSKSGTLSRVVGYYEGWSPQRPCNAIYPEQIPLGIYTHLNYAFASIDPNTFNVVPTYSTDPDLYRRLTALKAQDPDLKVNIAIGGWSFNDPGPSATTFSDLVASEDNQRAFFRSLISFMSTYDFDGVDIDWEYPGATDRSGRPEDFANYPKFIANLKQALSGTGGRDGLSVTLPASYWYLQNFDVESLSKNVDYFNFMTYDLHGLWDKSNHWTGPYLDSHTNMTEITLDFDLLWRNNVPPQKVVMGLAFYGRGFTVSSTSCTEPGCTFSSGSLPGNCSQTSSMLMNSEIKNIIALRGIESSLDQDAEVEILTWDDQWTTYDDALSFKLKTDFARSECLGGVMVWAVSHDDSNGTFSQSLSNTTIRPFTSLAVTSQAEYRSDGGPWANITVYEQHPQCRWTGCGEVCPSGYTAVSRGDSGARKGELMLDQTGCPSNSVHTYCCPSNSAMPTCGWYTHNNGKCDPACPDNTVEIGSNSMYCNKKYQAACCTTSEDSMKVYSTIQWSEWPDCDQGSCPWSDTSDVVLLANSTTGSGGATCNLIGAEDPSYLLYGYGNGNYPYSERKLCANTSNSELSFEQCAWHSDLGETRSGSSSFCRSSCPSGQVRTALDQYDSSCQGKGGARSFCCEAKYTTTTETINPALQKWNDQLTDFLQTATCPAPDVLNSTEEERGLLRRGVSGFATTYNGGISSLNQVDYLSMTLATLLQRTLITQLVTQMIATWNNLITVTFPNLVFSTLRPFMQSFTPFIEDGAQFIAFDLLCRMPFYEELVEDENPYCQGSICDADYEPQLCQEEDNADSSSSTQKRSSRTEDIQGGQDVQSRPSHSLDRRAGTGNKVYDVWCQSTNQWVTGLSINSFPYPSSGDWKPANPQYQNAKDLQFPNDCTDAGITTLVKNSANFDTEHVLELQVIPQFFESITAGNLMSGSPIHYTPVPCEFFATAGQTPGGRGAINLPLLANLPASSTGQSADPTPAERIMYALGATRNVADFYLLRKELNGVKSSIFKNNENIVNDMDKYTADLTNPSIALKAIRDVIAVWAYLNDPPVSQSVVNVANNVRAQLAITEQRWASQPNSFPIDLVNAWDEWFPDMLIYHAERCNIWIEEQIASMANNWQGQTGNTKAFVDGALYSLEVQRQRYVSAFAITLSL